MEAKEGDRSFAEHRSDEGVISEINSKHKTQQKGK
jgi:hypothetical protein